MAMPAAPVGADIGPRSLGVRRDPLPARLLSLVLFSAFLTIVLASNEQWPALRDRWKILIFWIALMLVIDFFPIHIAGTTLTLDTPILLAIAISEAPLAALLVAFVGSLDVRELRHEVSLSRAIFNRSQIAVCTYLAALAFHGVSPGLDSSVLAIAGVALAVVVEFCSNVALVSLHQHLLVQSPFLAILRRLVWIQGTKLVPIYLGYGVLGLVLALVSARVGYWAAATFLVPILVAREAVIRSKELQEVRTQLRQRENLVRGMQEKIVEERRDERLRIAGDLHDGLVQVLSQIRQLGERIKISDPVEKPFIDDLEELRVFSEEATVELREVIHDLRGSPLGRGGLIPTLRGLIMDVRLEHKVHIVESLPRAWSGPATVQTALYQAAREAIMNAVLHSGSKRVSVQVQDCPGEVVLTVEDGGRGFLPDLVDDSYHFGLGIMKERVRNVRGSLELTSSPGSGTRVRVRVPTSPSTGHAAPSRYEEEKRG